MKGVHIRYSDPELEWLEANRTLPIRDYAAAFNSAFGRDVSPANLHALRKRMGWRVGRTGRFEKGSVPVNKGRPRAFDPRCAATQFKRGSRLGRAAALYKPIGFEVVRDGYLVRKVNDDLPLQARWRPVHVIRWEEAHGPIPKNHSLKCLDGDRLNTDPSNWRLVHRGELLRLNGGPGGRYLPYDAAPAELRPTLLAVAALGHRASAARRGK